MTWHGRRAALVFIFVTVLLDMLALGLIMPVLGALSDRFGRRPIVLLSNVGLGLDYIVIALAPNVVWLLVGRVLSGLTSASITAAGAYVADVTEERERRSASASCWGRLSAGCSALRLGDPYGFPQIPSFTRGFLGGCVRAPRAARVTRARAARACRVAPRESRRRW